MTANRQTRWLLASVMLAAPMLSGCQAVWVVLEKMFPKEKVSAKFRLPANKTVLVFPDDLENPVSYPQVKHVLARRLSAILAEKKLAGETVPYERLLELQAAEPDFNLMSIPKIGRRLGADLVVYVNIEQFALKDNPVDTLWRGRFAGRVKVVDVLKGRIWPDESAGCRVKVNAPIADSTSEAFGGEVARVLAESLAVEVAWLFHDHYVERNRPKDTGSIFDE
jgi:hypothetical protein